MISKYPSAFQLRLIVFYSQKGVCTKFNCSVTNPKKIIKWDYHLWNPASGLKKQDPFCARNSPMRDEFDTLR